MGKSMIFFFFFFLLCMLFHVNYCASNFSSLSPGLSPKTCPPDESIALLQFKYSISTGDVNNGACGDAAYPKTNTWEEGADCCSWDGVTCDELTGHVIGLDLSCSRLNGSIRSNSSLFHLSHLQTLNLAYNFFLSHEISYLGSNYDLQVDNYAFQNLIHNFTELRVLDLSSSDMSLVETKSLCNISSTLRSLRLSDCFLNGEIPDDFSRFSLLEVLDLKENQFTGQIPDVFGHLTKLNTLSLARNNFVGPLPFSVFNLTQLILIDLSYNQIHGFLPNNVSNLSYLQNLDFSHNQLYGKIPSCLFTIPSLSSLILSNNKFTGCFPIHPPQQPNFLTYLDLSKNEIHGPIQNPIFELLSLAYLDLSFNNLSGIDIEWNMLQKLDILIFLDLSHNSELSLRGGSSKVNLTLPNLVLLDLSSCNITEFPDFLQTLENLTSLDLSNNKIHGRIPSKQGSKGWKKLQFLYLSNNSLTGLEQHPWNNVAVLDLGSNLIQGPLPVPPRGINVFVISKNKLSGPISSSICICSSLSMLDLSDNRLNGAIPRCLGSFRSLQILDLQNNNFQGNIPDAFANGSSLWYVNLNGNQFERQIPRSFVNCSGLQILDLGNNKISDTFPYWLGNLLQLKVLVLRSNNFHGVMSLPKKTKFTFEELQILDISHNQFNGILPVTLLGNLKSMMNVGENHDSKPKYLGDDQAYQVGGEVTITMKGSEFSMPQILTIFKYIDFSNNQFEGQIPEVVCKFQSLKVLNFSHNNLVGHIPSSIGNLTELESLDLSSNKLMGQIPQQLAALTSLEVLNMSYNLLVGPIPEGRQLSTFSNDSYIGNLGLCGFPLSKKCQSEPPPQPPSARVHAEDESTSWFDWKIVMMGYGCGVVIGLSMGYIVFATRKPSWFVKMVEKKQDKIVRRINQRRRGGRKLGNSRGRR